MEKIVTVITPTTGKESLFFLIESIKKQSIPVIHLILWGNKKEDRFLYPDKDLKTLTPKDIECSEERYVNYSIEIKNLRQNQNTENSLMASGLIIADTDYVTFAKENIMWEENHLESMLAKFNENKWAFCMRKIWSKISDDEYEYIGKDNFESTGLDIGNKFIDSNCLIFTRRFGSSAACIYRDSRDPNTDKLMCDFLFKHAGVPHKTDLFTINSVCEDKLVEFYRKNCTK